MSDAPTARRRFELTDEERTRLGQRLRDLRMANKITLAQVADAWGCDTSNVAHAEKGRQNLSVPQLVAFARLVRIDAAELLAGFTQAAEVDSNEERPLLSIDVVEKADSIVPPGTELRAVEGA